MTCRVPIVHRASRPSSSLLSPPRDLTHRQCGSERARRYWGCVPSEAEQKRGPSGRPGLTPHPQPVLHCPKPTHQANPWLPSAPENTLNPTHKVHTVLSQPVKTLEEEKEGEECNKAGAEVVPKDGEGQTSLSDSIPGTFQKVLGGGQGMMRTSRHSACPAPCPSLLESRTSYLHLCCPQLSKEHLAHHFAQEKDKDKGLDVEDLGVRISYGLRSLSALLCLGLLIWEPPQSPHPN